MTTPDTDAGEPGSRDSMVDARPGDRAALIEGGRRFTVVANGWDPDQVLGLIEDLEDRMRTLLAVRGDDPELAPDEVQARAEDAADQVRVRAETESRRLRKRARDEAMAIRIEAKRDAADIVASGRLLAEEIVASARKQEESVYRRISELRAVVRRTEDLLESVALGGAAVGSAGGLHRDFRLEIDERGDDLDLARTVTSAPRQRRNVPPQVRRLLDELQAPGSAGGSRPGPLCRPGERRSPSASAGHIVTAHGDGR